MRSTDRIRPLNTIRLACLLCLAFSACACTYLKYASVQAEYTRIQNAEPGQLNAKHMIDRERYVIHGRSIDATNRYSGLPKVIAAFSSKYRANERVDTMFFQQEGTHYGLNLAEGQYDLLILADIDTDGKFDASEVIGQRSVKLNNSTAPQKVVGQVDVHLTDPISVDWPISIDLPESAGRPDSLFFPAGTIRQLDDPIFSSSFSTMGMYDPAAFLEQAPTLFYALEEDLGYKIPVIFVHGIDGSARDFASFVEQLDRDQYKAWFYHYPSGGDLDQMAELFYQIFISGKLYRNRYIPVIVVAHSMGGLVVRQAINRIKGTAAENPLRLFISIATPFGGHAAAASGEKHGLIVLPSWRDLNPENEFIRNLYRKPLPNFVHHELIYAYNNLDTFKFGENSDGVVALASQLYPPAQRQARSQFGFNATHTGILKSERVIEHILAHLATVENPFPDKHLFLLQQGGYAMELGEGYSARAQYAIRNYGRYLMALSRGRLTPINPEESRFVSMVNGNYPPGNDTEEGWLRFLGEHPELK